jgi:hypothetical protein
MAEQAKARHNAAAPSDNINRLRLLSMQLVIAALGVAVLPAGDVEAI